MALTLTKKFNEYRGTKKAIGYEITFDGSTSGLTAASVGLNFIERVEDVRAFASGVITTSGLSSVQKISVTANNKGIDWVDSGALPTDGDKATLTLIGW